MNKRIKKKLLRRLNIKHWKDTPNIDVITRKKRWKHNSILPKALILKYSGRITKPRYKQLKIAVIRKSEFLAKKFAANAKTIRQDFVN